MTPQILEWLRFVKGRYSVEPDHILEVGSCDVNGSPRSVWVDCEDYVGVDMEKGPGVDIVADAVRLRQIGFANSFDLVLCCETLEHCYDPFVVVEGLRSHVTKPGGLLIITTPANGFPEHKYPNDYWRFMPDAYSMFYAGMEILEITEIPGLTLGGVGRMLRSSPIAVTGRPPKSVRSRIDLSKRFFRWLKRSARRTLRGRNRGQ